jgi:hypothetical protein
VTWLDYLRTADRSVETIKGIKAWIIEEYRHTAPSPPRDEEIGRE